MSQSTSDWRSARESKLLDDIDDLIESFNSLYYQPTPEDVAWSARVDALMRERIAALRAQLRTQPADMPIEQSVSVEPGESPSTRIALEVSEARLDPASQAMKTQRWLELWSKTEALIAEFETEHVHSAPDDRQWAAGVAELTRAEVAAQRASLQREHPDVPTIPEPVSTVVRPDRDIDILETLFAGVVDGVDPNDDELNDAEEAALARSGLDRDKFIAARNRMRALVVELPESARARSIELILAERRRRN